VFEEADRDPRQEATAVVLRFAETTNLSIAGRRFAVRGGGPVGDALAELLSAIGARQSEPGERPDYLFCVGADASVGRADLDSLLSASDRFGRPVIVVDATPDGSALDAGGALVDQLRDGVWATAEPDVVVVRVDGTRRTPDDSPAAARIAWARRFMRTAEGIASRLGVDGTVRGLRVGLSMVLEPKTAVLALILREAGADVSVFAHPDETDDAVAAALTAQGLRVFAHSAAGPAEHRALADAFLAERPHVLVDDGSHVIRLAHETAPETLGTMIGAAEETTSGLRPLRAMADEGRLRIPVVAVNDARSKTLFDNRYGTGQSCLFTILGLTDLDLAGSTVVVAGYGHVGEGVAHHAHAFGATVVVAELDPVRALAASFDGFRVAPLAEAAASARLVISATGVRDTISVPVLRACAPEAVIAVAGGVPQEIAIDEAVAGGAVRETIGH
jgi:adenosylhomocysteinase